MLFKIRHTKLPLWPVLTKGLLRGISFFQQGSVNSALAQFSLDPAESRKRLSPENALSPVRRAGLDSAFALLTLSPYLHGTCTPVE